MACDLRKTMAKKEIMSKSKNCPSPFCPYKPMEPYIEKKIPDYKIILQSPGQTIVIYEKKRNLEGELVFTCFLIQLLQ